MNFALYGKPILSFFQRSKVKMGNFAKKSVTTQYFWKEQAALNRNIFLCLHTQAIPDLPCSLLLLVIFCRRYHLAFPHRVHEHGADHHAQHK